MKKRLILLGVAVILLTPGCWNNRDLNEIAICTAIGLDMAQDGKLEVSVQIVNPSAAKSSGKQEGGGGGGGGGGSKPTVVVSNTADTVFGALRGMLSKVDRKIFYSSSQIIVISDEVARKGLKSSMDFFQRDHESQYKACVVIARDVTAKEVLEQEYDLARVPGVYIADTLQNVKSRGFSKRTMLIELIKDLAGGQKQLAIGAIHKEEDTTSTEGTAVFLKDKLVGWLDPFETRGMLFVLNEIRSTILEIPSPAGHTEKIAIELIRSGTKIDVKLKNNIQPVFTIKVTPHGNIGEQLDGGGMIDEKWIYQLEQGCNKKIKAEIVDAIQKCQEQHHSDIFSFGRELNKKYLPYWKTVEKDWNTVGFEKAEFHVEVKMEIQRTGLVKQGILSK